MLTSRGPLAFIGKVTLVSSVAYLFAGALAYQLLTKQFYVGDGAIFATFLRSEANAEEWNHVMTWQFPMLFVRGLLIALVLLPFQEALRGFNPRKRVLVLFGLFFVLIHLAAAAPSPSNLEGFVYMRPELMSLRPFLLTQPEMIAQSLLFALGVALWACKTPTPDAKRAGADVLNPGT
jgi:hypothetical protein